MIEDMVVQNDGAWRHSATKYLRQPAFCRRCAGCSAADVGRSWRRDELDELRERARGCASSDLRGLSDEADLAEAKRLVEELRNERDYEPMGELAEAVSRRDPKDAKNRRLYAQYLIDTGKATAAIDVLQRAGRRLPKDDPEFAEATGLLGRAYKQIFFDAGDKTSPGAREALKQAIAAYRGPYERTPGEHLARRQPRSHCSPVRDGSGCAWRPI